MDWALLSKNVVSAIVFSIVGLMFFGIAFWAAIRFCPFSFRKEIEEDQNTALAILVGSVIIGIAIIVQAAMHG